MFNSYARSQSPPACLVPLILIGFRAPLHVLFTNTLYFRAILNTVNEWASKQYEYWVRSGLYFFCLYADVSRCLSCSRKLRKSLAVRVFFIPQRSFRWRPRAYQASWNVCDSASVEFSFSESEVCCLWRSIFVVCYKIKNGNTNIFYLSLFQYSLVWSRCFIKLALITCCDRKYCK